jgi:hypothetical protein
MFIPLTNSWERSHLFLPTPAQSTIYVLFFHRCTDWIPPKPWEFFIEIPTSKCPQNLLWVKFKSLLLKNQILHPNFLSLSPIWPNRPMPPGRPDLLLTMLAHLLRSGPVAFQPTRGLAGVVPNLEEPRQPPLMRAVVLHHLPPVPDHEQLRWLGPIRHKWGLLGGCDAHTGGETSVDTLQARWNHWTTL